MTSKRRSGKITHILSERNGKREFLPLDAKGRLVRPPAPALNPRTSGPAIWAASVAAHQIDYFPSIPEGPSHVSGVADPFQEAFSFEPFQRGTFGLETTDSFFPFDAPSQLDGWGGPREDQYRPLGDPFAWEQIDFSQ
jgi:hypothetical protein